MIINAQVCFMLLSYIPPSSAEFSFPPILEVAQLRHQGIGIDAPGVINSLGPSQLSILQLPLQAYTARNVDIGAESRFLPTTPAFDAPVRPRGVLIGILP